MSAWSYCPKCDAGLGPCNLSEAFREHVACPSCGGTIPANQTFDDALEYVDRELVELRERVAVLEMA